MDERYTVKMESGLWDFNSMDGDSDYASVMDFLNTNKQSFGEALIYFYRKIYPDTDSVQVRKALEQQAKAKDIVIASPGALDNWFKQGKRPKKSQQSRQTMFRLAFAMGLDILQTAELFHKVYLDRAFNRRSREETIYYYCLRNRLTWQHAQELIRITDNMKSDAPASDETVYTIELKNAFQRITSDAELLTFLTEHSHNFELDSVTALRTLDDYKQRALACAKEAAESERAFEPEAYKGMDMTSTSFLYHMITNQVVAGKAGTVTMSLKDTILPQEIRNNFPQPATFSLKDPNFEEIRKMLVMLFSYVFWMNMRKYRMKYDKADDYYDDYVDQLNDLLERCSLPPLYYGSAYDWLILYCTATEDPLDTFQDILAYVLDGADE